jgi:hypothetical protein
MKRLLTILVLACAAASSFGATLNPVQLLNPAGSTSGQAILSTGAGTAPAWGNVTATSLGAQAANTVVANFTGASASPTAFAMPSCSTSSSALQYTSGTGFACNASINAATLGGSALGTSGGTVPLLNGVNTWAGNQAFSTFTASAMSRVVSSDTNTQSIPNNTLTTITNWTAATNIGSNFVASTGVYTAPATGQYDVRAAFRASAVVVAAGAQFNIAVTVNGSVQCQSGSTYENNVSTVMQANVSCIVNATSGQTIVVQIFQNSGSAVSLDGGSATNWMQISRLY